MAVVVPHGDERAAARAAWLPVLLAAGVLVWAWQRSHSEPVSALPAPRGLPLDVAAAAPDAPDSSAPATREDEILEPPEPGAEIEFPALEFPDYDPPQLRPVPRAALGVEAFPPAARRLHRRELGLLGFPLVTETAGNEVRALLLTRYPPGCCFGAVPVFDEWVLVELREPLAARDVPRRALARGTLEVGERLDETGTALHLYRLQDAELEAR